MNWLNPFWILQQQAAMAETAWWVTLIPMTELLIIGMLAGLEEGIRRKAGLRETRRRYVPMGGVGGLILGLVWPISFALLAVVAACCLILGSIAGPYYLSIMIAVFLAPDKEVHQMMTGAELFDTAEHEAERLPVAPDKLGSDVIAQRAALRLPCFGCEMWAVQAIAVKHTYHGNRWLDLCMVCGSRMRTELEKRASWK